MEKISLAVSFENTSMGDVEKLTQLLETAKTQDFNKIYVSASKEHLEGLEFDDIVLVEDTSEKQNFQSRLNTIANSSDEEYLMLVSHEDSIGEHIVSTYKEYLSTYGEEYKMYLPITVRVSPSNEMLDMTNTLGWSASLYQQIDAGHQPLGIINMQVYDAMPTLNVHGLLIERETYLDMGGLKENFTYGYAEEFFRRMFHNDVQAVNLNYLGYRHLFDLNNYDKNEITKWIDLGKKEYMFTQERELELV